RASFRLASRNHLPAEGYSHGYDRCTACGPQGVRTQILLAHGVISRPARAPRFRPELLSPRHRAVISPAEPDASAGGHSPRVGVHFMDAGDCRANAADRRTQARDPHAPRQADGAPRYTDDPG